ncbi:MAG: 2OG-Fe(II) oxygenase [Tsuneonella sp.]
MLIYLNDGYSGGRTLFSEIPFTVEPVAGDAVVFDGLDASGALLRASRHAGEPVAQGVKWMATRWIRQRPFNPWTAASPTA